MYDLIGYLPMVVNLLNQLLIFQRGMRNRFQSFFQLVVIFAILIGFVWCQSSKTNAFIGWYKQLQPFGFGSNKPHLLFHLGSRQALSYNLGYGYWLVKSEKSIQRSSTQTGQSNMYSELRYKYQNTQQQLYVNVLNHDGQRLIHEEIKDHRYKVNSEIKYNYLKNDQINEFQYQVQMSQFNNEVFQGQNDIFNNSKVKLKGSQYMKDFQQGDMTWFMSIAVQNNDLRLINHKDYLSPLCLRLQKQSNNKIKVHLQQLKLQPKGQYDFSVRQTLTFRGQNLKSIKMFGFSVNISESFQAHNYLNEFKHLLELQRYPHLNVQRSNDSKVVDWENRQIEQIKKGKFDSKYTYVIIYGTVSRQALLDADEKDRFPSVYVTNSTKKQKKFEQKNFDENALQNQNNFFGSQLQKLDTVEDKKFVKHVIFNLLGGLAYYQGKLYTQNSIISHQQDYSFTFTPSRLIFPRSFLWDDGFHNTVIARYKPQLVMQTMHSWFKKIDLFGWIGRQQIRGFQISSMMPDSRFIYQDSFELNPPTIVMPILKLIQSQDQLSEQVNKKLKSLLLHHYSSLEKNFRYFLKTQSHFDLAYKEDVSKTIKYRWRCKDQCEKGNFMGSGLDDYPRVQNKTQISKEHVDLSSWLWFFSDALEKMGKFIGRDKAARFYGKWKNNLREKIIEQCLDQTDMLFKDLAVKGQKIFIDQKVTKIGYINLFPFFVGILQDKKNQSAERKQKILNVLSKTIGIMMDQNVLMSLGGIRSLSLKDQDYASEQNYWRGAVWMPINYMILRACKRYYWNLESQIHRQKVHSLYTQLRSRLIKTVYENYKQKGYLFENYIEGEGNRGYPFYGWTSLIASIMLEDY